MAALPRSLSMARLAERPLAACLVALVLAAVIAALDQATGYAYRLNILYLAPIALATWIAGWRAGLALVALSSLPWLLATVLAPSGGGAGRWDGAVPLVVHLACVLLLVRLRFF